MMKNQVPTFPELFQAETGVLAPCVFDCASARVAELAGFKAICLSGAELSMAMDGLPDLGILNLSELVWIVSRITDNCPLPLIVDAEDGFGSPINVYRTCERLAKAGAKAILLEDEAEPGFAKGVVSKNIIPREEYFAKVKAAKAALEGSGCIFIARTNVPLENGGLEEAIARSLGSLEQGADMTLVTSMKTMEEAQAVAAAVPGYKMFPDINQSVKQPTLRAADLYPLGFNLVTMHFLFKGAMVGMLNYALRTAKEQNNLYPRDDVRFGVSGQSGQPFYPVQDWLDFEAEFTGVSRKFWGDALKLDE